MPRGRSGRPATRPRRSCPAATSERAAGPRPAGRAAPRGPFVRPLPEILFTSNLSLIVEACKRLGLLTILTEHVVAGEVERGDMVALPCEHLRFDYTVSLLGWRRGSHTAGLNLFVELVEQAFGGQ